MSFEVGAIGEGWLRGSGRELFFSDVSRRWWEAVGGERIRAADTARKKRVYGILSEEWAFVTHQEKAKTTAASDAMNESETPDKLS